MGGVGNSDIRANSVQLILQLPTGTELGKIVCLPYALGKALPRDVPRALLSGHPSEKPGLPGLQDVPRAKPDL